MLRTLLSAAAAVMMSLTLANAQESTIADMVQGDPDAKIEIIEYASYTCPHCATFHAGPYKELKKDYTIVIVTHSMQQARRISDRTAFFLMGELVEHDDTQAIFNEPKDDRTKGYVNGDFG